MTNAYTTWRKAHRFTFETGSFRNRSHPIRKIRFEDKTVYRCIPCRETFEKEGANKIRPKAPKVFKRMKRSPLKKIATDNPLHRLDRIWGTIIKLRALERSEYSGLSRTDGHTLHPHHIDGKSTLALRYSLQNGICLTGIEHASIAHCVNAETAKKFKAWAMEFRGVTIEQFWQMRNGGIRLEVDVIEDYLKDALEALKNGNLTPSA